MRKYDFELTVSYRLEDNAPDDKPFADIIGPDNLGDTGTGFGIFSAFPGAAQRDLRFNFASREKAENAINQLVNSNISVDYQWDLTCYDTNKSDNGKVLAVGKKMEGKIAVRQI